MFLRGKPQLHERMKRIPARHRKAPVNEANKCPNFYKIAQTSPLPEVPMTRSGDRRVVNQTSENACPVERAVSSNVASVSSLHQNILFEALAQSLARRDMVVPTSVASVNARQVFPPRNDGYDAQLVDQILSQRMNYTTNESMRVRNLVLDNILNRSNNGALNGNFLRQRNTSSFDSISQRQSQLYFRTSEPNLFSALVTALDYRGPNSGASSIFHANAFIDLDERYRDHRNILIAARSERSGWVGDLSLGRMNDVFSNDDETGGYSNVGFRW